MRSGATHDAQIKSIGGGGRGVPRDGPGRLRERLFSLPRWLVRLPPARLLPFHFHFHSHSHYHWPAAHQSPPQQPMSSNRARSLPFDVRARPLIPFERARPLTRGCCCSYFFALSSSGRPPRMTRSNTNSNCQLVRAATSRTRLVCAGASQRSIIGIESIRRFEWASLGRGHRGHGASGWRTTSHNH